MAFSVWLCVCVSDVFLVLLCGPFVVGVDGDGGGASLSISRVLFLTSCLPFHSAPTPSIPVSVRRPTSRIAAFIVLLTVSTVSTQQGHVWLAGDNPDNSKDSRNYGPVPQALVEGVASIRLWPLKDFGYLN